MQGNCDWSWKACRMGISRAICTKCKHVTAKNSRRVVHSIWTIFTLSDHVSTKWNLIFDISSTRRALQHTSSTDETMNFLANIEPQTRIFLGKTFPINKCAWLQWNDPHRFELPVFISGLYVLTMFAIFSNEIVHLYVDYFYHGKCVFTHMYISVFLWNNVLFSLS